MHPAEALRRLTALVARLYSTREEARALLIEIDYPPDEMPDFGTARTFWAPVVRGLDDWREGASFTLLKAVSERHLGNTEAQELLARWPEPSVSREPEIARGPRDPGSRIVEPGDIPPPGTPPDTVHVPRDTSWCPTLTLAGADLPDELVLEVRRVLGSDDVHLLYVADRQSAVRVPDPGERGEALRCDVQLRMRGYAPACDVSYRRYPFEPYVYARLTVIGPDLSAYHVHSVPATSTPEDIAAALVARTHEIPVGAHRGLVRVVVDLGSGPDAERLEPFTTLHEGKVRDGHELRVAPEAIAGSIAPAVRLKELLRALDQLRGYAAHEPDFAVVSHDDEDLPGRITVEIEGRGLAPPAGVERFREADGSGRLDDLVPSVVRSHRISLYFRPMFPLVAPCVVWETPVFHPNICPQGRGEFPAGTLLHPRLLLDYHPKFPMDRLARTVTAVATYRDYHLDDDPDDAPDPLATRWAGAEDGQVAIAAIGGRRLDDLERDGGVRPGRYLLVEPFGEVRDGA